MKITIKIHPRAAHKLKLLVRTGLFGINTKEAAERMFCDGMIQHEPLLQPQKKK